LSKLPDYGKAELNNELKGKTAQLAVLALVFLLFFVFLFVFSGCKTPNRVSEKIGVAVTILPQAEFVESIGGDKVAVTVMVPPGAEPHTYEPKPGQMVELSKAQMYAKLGSGIEFELANMDKITGVNKNILVVDCSKGITLIKSEDPDEPGMDSHIWMSPLNAKIMVQNICEGLVQIAPANKSFYEKNRDIYMEKLTRLDQDIRSGLSEVKNRTFIIYHPFLGYFAREYNLTQVSIEELGKEPTASHIAELIARARKDNIKVVFVSPQFNSQSAKVIASGIGGRVIPIDDLSREYLTNLRTISNELIEAMK
jgi:zinc transport system substrate-binding protein